MRNTLLAAIALLGLSLSPAFAGDGDMGPVPQYFPQGSQTFHPTAAVADTGNNAYPVIAGRPGSALRAVQGNVLASNSASATVQSPNSLPPGAANGLSDYADATKVQNWVLARNGQQSNHIYAGDMSALR